MVDAVSPLITIIYEIFNDMGWFLVILLVTMFSFSVSFYMLALNQIEFDGLSESEIDQLQYGTIIGSTQFVFGIVYTQWATNFFD